MLLISRCLLILCASLIHIFASDYQSQEQKESTVLCWFSQDNVGNDIFQPDMFNCKINGEATDIDVRDINLEAPEEHQVISYNCCAKDSCASFLTILNSAGNSAYNFLTDSKTHFYFAAALLLSCPPGMIAAGRWMTWDARWNHDTKLIYNCPDKHHDRGYNTCEGSACAEYKSGISLLKIGYVFATVEVLYPLVFLLDRMRLACLTIHQHSPYWKKAKNIMAASVYLSSFAMIGLGSWMMWDAKYNHDSYYVSQCPDSNSNYQCQGSACPQYQGGLSLVIIGGIIAVSPCVEFACGI